MLNPSSGTTHWFNNMDGPIHTQPPHQPLLGSLFANPFIPHQQLLTACHVQPTAQLAQQTIHEQMLHYIILLISILIAATAQLALPTTQIPQAPEPYHTSTLSSHEWVMELIIGHPDHIHCELGVYVHIF